MFVYVIIEISSKGIRRHGFQGHVLHDPLSFLDCRLRHVAKVIMTDPRDLTCRSGKRQTDDPI
jgi:hypothetical protein